MSKSARHAPASDQILKAASDIISTDGLDALTVRAVAVAARTTTMSVYSRFGGKDGLLDALFEQGFSLLAELQAAVMASEMDPEQRLLALCSAYRELALARPAHYRLMTRLTRDEFLLSGTSESAARAAFDTLARVSVNACANEERGRMLAGQVYALCHGVVLLETSGGFPPGQDGALLLSTAVRALIDQAKTP